MLNQVQHDEEIAGQARNDGEMPDRVRHDGCMYFGVLAFGVVRVWEKPPPVLPRKTRLAGRLRLSGFSPTRNFGPEPGGFRYNRTCADAVFAKRVSRARIVIGDKYSTYMADFLNF